jgi:predicted CXXCH cytochrome family protein
MCRNSLWSIIIFTIFTLTIHLDSAWAQKGVVSKSYYTPVYKEANESSTVIGNLLKNQRAEEVLRKNGFVKINAFRGLIVGWAKEGDLEATSSRQKDRSELKDGVSPVMPPKSGFDYAANHKSPHKGGYQGVQYCVRCHNPGASTSQIPGAGRPIEVWSSSAHAEAYLTLFKPESVKLGRKLGISDPHKSPKCLKCHVTGYGSPSHVSNKVAMSEGVGCESCHGPSGALHDSKQELDVSKVDGRAQFCQRCHNDQSPTWKGFNLESFSEYISHWSHYTEVRKIRESEHKTAKSLAKKEGGSVIELKPNLVHRPTTPKAKTKVNEAGVIVLDDGQAAPVHFPHQKHQTEFGLECSSCHHIPQMHKCRSCHTPSSSATRKQIFHGKTERSCRGCHRSMASKGFAGPLTCSGCHIK